MFKTRIDSKEIKVTFQHQKAAHRSQLTRPKICPLLLEDSENPGKFIRVAGCVRVPVFANTFCFFNDLCVGVAFCSYSDEKKYSKEIGEQVALQNALKTALKRSGKNDRDVAEERAQVWEDYFRAEKGKRAMSHPLVFGRALRKMAEQEQRELTEIPSPTPLDSDSPSILEGNTSMNEEAIGHLNQRDQDKSDFLDNYRTIYNRDEDINR